MSMNRGGEMALCPETESIIFQKQGNIDNKMTE